MKPSLNIVMMSEVPIFQQLQWEEALLRVDQQNWCLINKGSPPAIVMGISGKIENLIEQEKLKQFPIPLIRRFSGGGTVVIDENTLFVTLICQADSIPISPFPRPLMEWTAKLYQPLFTSHSFQLKENDYVIGEKKWGGNAQSIIKGRWLHHTSILWDFHPQNMEYLSIPSKTPAYRQGRNHQDFLCRLKDYWPNSHHFQSEFIKQLGKHFDLNQIQKQDIQKIASLPHRKMTTLIDN